MRFQFGRTRTWMTAACAVLTLVVTGSVVGVGAASAGAAAPDLPQGTIFTGFGDFLRA